LDKIYRVQLERKYTDRVDLTAGVTAGVAPFMKEEFPEVQSFVKLWGTSHMRNIIRHGSLSIESEKLYFASEDFFRIFTFPLVSGNPETALANPNTAVITKSLAKKIFGENNPLGKTFIYHNSWEATNVEITGIVEDVPVNSHLKFDMLVSFKTLERFIPSAADSFGWSAFNTYLLMNGTELPPDFQNRVDQFISTHYAPLMEQGIKVNLYFQPLAEVYLGPEIRFQPETGGSREILQTLTIAAIFILLLAWLNYINLSTASVRDRALEVGVRKVAGASKKDLVMQFLFEAFILNLLAIIISLMVVELSHSLLNTILGKQIPGEIYLRPDTWLISGILVLGGTLLSGFYPAIALASFKPLSVLKGSHGGSKFLGLRKGLVAFQLLVSFMLISGTLVIYHQIRFMQQKNLGVSLDKVVAIKGPGLLDSAWTQKLFYLKQQISGLSDIQMVANTTSIPGIEITWVNNDVRWLGNPDDNRYSLPFTGISSEYLDLMNISLLKGRNFVDGMEAENENVLLTASAAKVLGFTTPEAAIGERVTDSNIEYTVVGVTSDFHQQSLNKRISPVIFRYVPNANSYLVVRLNTGSISETIGFLEQEWSEVFTGNPFDYFFLDEFFENQYSSDKRFVNIFGIFTIIGLFIGGLGLLALSLFMVRRRESEMSIRKVMGATDLQIMKLFTSEIFTILGIAVVLGVPSSYYLSDRLLQNYPYKIPFQFTWVIAPFGILLAILVITSAWRIIQISMKSPVEAIREQ
jgi:putative ABC transport system permease protein